METKIGNLYGILSCMRIFGSRMQKKKRKYTGGARLAVLTVALVVVWSVMGIHGAGEWYVQTVYPVVTSVLSYISSPFPFSLGDCFVYGSIVGLVVYWLHALFRRKSFIRVLMRTVEYLAFVYAWFYLSWGLTYFRQDFFHRTETQPVAYEKAEFQSFLSAYTDSLNATYCAVNLDAATVDRAVKDGYRTVSPALHLLVPRDYQRGKPMLVTPLMSAVGVKGYIEAFFMEANLSGDLLPVEYPSTYAHEMAHVLGVSSEAEANLCAYLVCTGSPLPEMRFSGYLSLLSYVLGNAYGALTEEEFVAWKETLRPEVRQLYNDKVNHWHSLYSPWIGEVQHTLYNFYLKGNNIPSGTANYSEVITLLMAWRYAASLHD